MVAARTSSTHPLQIAEVRASPAHGRIGITFCPGAWARDLAVDLDVIAAWGAKLVVALRVPTLGEHVVGRGIHCKGGLGRAGMIAARLLVELGTPPDAAIHAVRRARPGAIETPAQLARVRATASVNGPDAEVVDTATWRKVGSGSGSNPAGIYANGDGRPFYVKSLESPAHARNDEFSRDLRRQCRAHMRQGRRSGELIPLRRHLRAETMVARKGDMAKARSET